MESLQHNQGEFRLKFDGSKGGHQVSADVLIRTLQGIQSAIWQLANASTNRAIVAPNRVRQAKSVKDAFVVQCTAIEPGSVILRFVVGTVAVVASSLFDEGPTPNQILSQYASFMLAVVQKNDAEMKRVVPDSFYRERLVRESLKYLPKQDEDWWVDLQTDQFTLDGKAGIRLDRKCRVIAQKLLEMDDEDSGRAASFIARVDSVNFKTEQVDVYYEPTNRKFSLKYQFDTEDSLVESRRRMVEIKALCKLDSDGHPTSVIEVRSIIPHDLSPLVIAVVIDDDRQFEIDPPLVLEPKSDEDSKGYLLVVEEPSLKLSVCATTRSNLESEVSSVLLFLWDNYANEQDDKMTSDAIGLKRAVLNRMKEVR